jgi:hypothetical protein
MFEAQVLFKGCTIYSPWFPRRGDNVRCTIDVDAISGATIEVRLFTKNTEDIGDGTDVDATVTLSLAATGRDTDEWPGGLEELVRYKFTVTGTNNYDWVLFRMLPPVWFDAVKV